LLVADLRKGNHTVQKIKPGILIPGVLLKK